MPFSLAITNWITLMFSLRLIWLVIYILCNYITWPNKHCLNWKFIGCFCWIYWLPLWLDLLAAALAGSIGCRFRWIYWLLSLDRHWRCSLSEQTEIPEMCCLGRSSCQHWPMSTRRLEEYGLRQSGTFTLVIYFQYWPQWTTKGTMGTYSMWQRHWYSMATFTTPPNAGIMYVSRVRFA